jgi:hypothetical protein
LTNWGGKKKKKSPGLEFLTIGSSNNAGFSWGSVLHKKNGKEKQINKNYGSKLSLREVRCANIIWQNISQEKGLGTIVQ